MSRKTLQNSVMRVKRLKLSTQDAVGGITQTKISVFTAPCRVRQLAANEIPVGGKDGVVSSHRIYCDRADIRHQDEIIINKVVYDVNTINSGSANKGGMEIDCTLRR